MSTATKMQAATGTNFNTFEITNATGWSRRIVFQDVYFWQRGQ